MVTLEAVLRRIQEIRKIKGQNLHSCAAFLNISKEDYLRFEQGSMMLSLPEIELLAAYLGVSPGIFFQDDDWENAKLNLLDDHIQPQFTKLRDKMIKTKISTKMNETEISPEAFSEETGIPLSDLNAYRNGEQSIPLNHLLIISDALGIPSRELIAPLWDEKPKNKPQMSYKQQENSVKESQAEAQSVPYDQLRRALQQLPKKQQAEVTKIVFKKLQSQKNG